MSEPVWVRACECNAIHLARERIALLTRELAEARRELRAERELWEQATAILDQYSTVFRLQVQREVDRLRRARGEEKG